MACQLTLSLICIFSLLLTAAQSKTLKRD
ncbi:hypothetical protein CISIN_1g0203981mg, partial [Citrus sinensis]